MDSVGVERAGLQKDLDEFSEQVLDVLRDGNDTAEMTWGLMHLASPELTPRPSFVGHTPLAHLRLADVATALVNRLGVDHPQLRGAPSHPYSLGFSEAQAKAILATRRLTSPPRDSLFHEWGECASKVATLEAPLYGEKEAEGLVLAELAEMRKRHARPRRTVSRQ